MFNWVIFFIILIILLLILLYNVVNWYEPHALYYPSKKRVWIPNVPYKSIYINVNDSSDICCSKNKKKGCDYISAWHFNNFKNAKTVLFCHGNTGNKTYRQYIIDMCKDFRLNLIVFDTRGFGSSSSFPDKLFLREDGESVYKYLHDRCGIPSNKIIVWGESLGGITAVWVASKYNCGALILLCSFSSLDDAITYRYKGGKKIASQFITGLLAYKMDMLPVKEYLDKVNCPVVIVHSDKDEMIPYACSWINYRSVKHNNKLHVRIKGGHSSPIIKSRQLREIFEFCDLSLDDLSSDVDISDILENLTGFAKKHNNFMD